MKLACFVPFSVRPLTSEKNLARKTPLVSQADDRGTKTVNHKGLQDKVVKIYLNATLKPQLKQKYHAAYERKARQP